MQEQSKEEKKRKNLLHRISQHKRRFREENKEDQDPGMWNQRKVGIFIEEQKSVDDLVQQNEFNGGGGGPTPCTKSFFGYTTS